LFNKFSNGPTLDRPVFIAGSGRCGSTLLQSILNTNSDFLIWGEHNGFLRQVAAAYYQAPHPRFPDGEGLSATARVERLRDPRRWPAWDNLCGETEFRASFQDFVRSFFADPEGRASRWGFKEIRYPRDAQDQTLPFLFDCFPEAKLILLVREPRPTLFSMLSRWVLSPDQTSIQDQELDVQILVAAEAWNAQYTALHRFSQDHASRCSAVRYEDLGSPSTWRNLAALLESSPFDFRSQMAMVKDSADKTGPLAARLHERMLALDAEIDRITRPMSAVYGYPVAAAEPKPASLAL
jgi:hypothetical protein